MTESQISIARTKGKLPFKCTKNNKECYTISESLEQAGRRFTSWTIESINWDIFYKHYIFS